MPSIESFYGRMENESDCLVLIDLARRGLIPRVQRRLTPRERKQIRHGSIFVYCEEESAVRRWTDNMAWSPSRVQGVFLMYKQLLTGSPLIKKTYSAVCGDRNFHVVGYLQADFTGDELPPVSILYRGVGFPTDIRIKKKLSFQQGRCYKSKVENIELAEPTEGFRFDAYWY
ncbi:gluconate trasport protein [Encephalitozoon hellem]|nr:gluconate trasport protein [Encephalitozoon hellem]